ncbi:hypothetical protein FB451DRAFT_793272 [Mycena latifolia]|nr:hypothetical protein FB451DRAFT_793272 [Mycena latifolia]
MCAAITCGMLSKLIPYTTRADKTDPYSRVGKHHAFLAFLMCIWCAPVLHIIIGVLLGAPTSFGKCIAEGAPTLLCLPSSLNIILPLAIFATLIRASWTVFHRAVALHGEANVSLPPGMPHPANFFWVKTHAPETGSLCGCWLISPKPRRMRRRLS